MTTDYIGTGVYAAHELDDVSGPFALVSQNLKLPGLKDIWEVSYDGAQQELFGTRVSTAIPEEAARAIVDRLESPVLWMDSAFVI